MYLPNFILLIPACLGLITLSKSLLHIFRWVWVMFLRPARDLKIYGSWAMVTGSTDGIGKALAFELASKGLNLVLVGRDPSKLQTTSNEIEQKYSSRVLTRTLVVDFSTCRGEEIARRIDEGTKGLDLGILINNVGLTYPHARFLHELDSEVMESVVRVNVVGTTWVTRTVILRMLEKKTTTKKKGVVVNVGSGSSACVPSFPLKTIYAATKAYVAMLSRSLSMEYKHHGINVQCQIPLFVATKMTSMKGSSLFVPSAKTYSKASVRWIGHQDQICVPYWPHALQACALSFLPEPLLDWCLFGYFLGLRAQGLQKESHVGS